MLAIAEVKHGFVYNVETNRKSFDANVTSFDLMDTYLPPFAATLRDGKAHGYMCSYNAVCLDGGECVPSCASRFLSNSTARAHWAFQGFVESDCDSVGDIYENFGFNGSHDSTTASALAMAGGCDIDCGKTYNDKHGGLAAAVAQNLTSERAVRDAFIRAMTPVFAAGQFDALNSTTRTPEHSRIIHTKASKVGPECHARVVRVYAGGYWSNVGLLPSAHVVRPGLPVEQPAL